ENAMTAVTQVEAAFPRREPRERGYWAEAWHELRHDWSAMLGLGIAAALVLAAIFAPLLAPYSPTFQQSLGLSESGSPLPPNGHFLLGTDSLGRDELSRLLYGARISLLVGIASNALAAAIGIGLGGTAGMAGARLQTPLMRLVDVILSFPVLLLAIALL